MARLIVAVRRSGVVLDCRARWGPAGTALALESSSTAIALDVHLQDGGVMDEAIDGGECHGVVGEHLSPFAEWLIGGDQQRAPFLAPADEFEQHAGFGLILADIGDVIEDEQVIFVELGDGVFEIELTTRDLQALDEIAGAHEEHAPAGFHESEPEGCREMTLAGAWRAEQQEIGAV